MRIFKTVLFLVLSVFSTVVMSMSIMNAGKSCVFSSVDVVVTRSGVPVSGAEVVRTSEWQKEQVETTTTDDRGHFTFPALYHASVSKFVPFSEFVASQSIVVKVDGEEYEIWANGKRDPKENSEFGGQPIQLTCELSEDVRLVEDFDTLLVTNCRW